MVYVSLAGVMEEDIIVVHAKIHTSNSQQPDYIPFEFHAKSGTGSVTDEEAVPPGTKIANNQLNSEQFDPGNS